MMAPRLVKRSKSIDRDAIRRVITQSRLKIGRMITRPRDPTMHPAAYSYWEPAAAGFGWYPVKEPPHGALCGGCGNCAHCPTKYPGDPIHDHSHGWWREELLLDDDDIAISDDVEEWIVAMDSYVTGTDPTSKKMLLSLINIRIVPLPKGHKDRVKDPNDDEPTIVARAPTYAEVLLKYEEYIRLAVRKERARVMK